MTSLFSDKTVISSLAKHTVEDLEFIKTLIETKQTITVFDRENSLDQVVEAHHYVESGVKIGHVILTVHH